MKKLLLLLVSILFLSTNALSLDTKQAVSTSQTGGRFEIIQSELVRKNTFLLDKYFGQVYVLVKKSNDYPDWEPVKVYPSSTDESPKNKINYQIFMGGIMARDCFLLNINTGETWILVETKDKGYMFEQFF